MSNALFDPVKEMDQVLAYRKCHPDQVMEATTKRRYSKAHVLRDHLKNPTNEDLHWSPAEGIFSANWGTGHIVIDVALAKEKLPAAQLRKIYKLGGL